MKSTSIKRIEYKNLKKKTDFEIVDLQSFFESRPEERLKRDFRLNFWAIIYIVKGSGYHWVDFQRYAYKKGDILFVQKNQVSRFEINKDAQGYVLHINEPFFYRIQGFKGDMFLDFVDRAFGSPLLSFEMNEESTHRILINLMFREYAKNTQDINIELIASLFQGFVLDLRSQVTDNMSIMLSKDYDNFKTYRQLIEENYMKTKNVEDYAEMMHVSKKTINQSTRKVVGLSAKQFIINRIILEIKRYLSQGEMLNYEIADLLGFEEAANMTKFFKHYEGLSPKEFKENIEK